MIIGVTFGVFDLLHAGHVMMLREAKSKCDYLIVGLKSEIPPDSNYNRPVQTLVERFIQLDGCRFVDEIIPFESEEELIDLLQSLNINIRIIGSEYKSRDFTGKDYCLDSGIEIYYNKRANRFSCERLRSTIVEVEKLKIAKSN